MNIRTPGKLTAALMLMLSACNQSAAPDPDIQDPVSGDLPFDSTDQDLSCDDECPVYEEGTAYEVGECRYGQCGPVWYWEYYGAANVLYPETLPPPRTCDEVCSSQAVSCVAQGCNGKTAFTCGRLDWSGCEEDARLDWTGACMEVVPWPEFWSGAIPNLACCCQ